MTTHATDRTDTTSYGGDGDRSGARVYGVGPDGQPHPLAHLSDEDIELLGKEFDAIHDDVYADLGDGDRRYIKSVIAAQRQLAVLGRVVLLNSRSTPAWVVGTACLGMAKILENMEIGHNVMHGQWDWMNDPDIHSSVWDWDTASTAEAWKHSHNYVHHTYTNIRGKDKDLGYEIMRIDPHQPWSPVYLLQPFYNVVLMAFFEWGVAVHDLDIEAIRRGDKPAAEIIHDLKGIAGKARRQIVKDYLGWPAVSAAAFLATHTLTGGRLDQPATSRTGRLLRTVNRRTHLGPVTLLAAAADRVLPGAEDTFLRTAGADFVANLIRNVWSNAIIFCGHFPDQAYTFSQDETADETRGGWYARQLIGAANIEGSPLFHIISGNLGYQVEHHLYPDMPSTRYAQVAPRVKDICQRYGLPYNTGPFHRQWAQVQRTILRLALPGGHPRPKPGPYHRPPHSAPTPTRPSEATHSRNRIPHPNPDTNHPTTGPEHPNTNNATHVTPPPRT
ncbi:fatty acid desaturase family protein [Williamsia sterculiae]|uniref:Linoleoyl-CoA desaturase n=1 Tax=Williamsia sterculiae TaxID=1344003 RepID=A0A1N7CAR3_9NOCA|nr:acyl-CoA desaturase [Williamsia sterculiae]SIR60547.1 linoleoyl-CoA desaturase [Williamsia sterculiae]SIS05595.1 linoleoyl-CoA desaturase [Williamsia sterculiae]SIS15837.1 linoleoyl-CoA desaturase [Williamsia sterculiae]SIS22798.1 linoleoyl-CoA desaturase [Williamsia sterculiae]